MRKILYKIFIAILLIQVTSCNQDFLNFQPSDQFGEETVWKDRALVQTFINDIYGNIGHGFHHSMMGVLDDELHHRSEQGGTAFVQSLITSSNLGVFKYSTTNNSMGQPSSMSWDNVYKNARACALFFDKIDLVPFDDEAMRDRMKGEVHFLRAYHYHTLVFTTGGVPIITKAYKLNDNFKISRSTFKECIDFIISELDQAAALLPLSYDKDNKGRATKGAALALKARVLLYAASDLYHTTSWQAGYANPELVGYVGANRSELYQAAKDAADAVIKLGQYSLYKPVPATDTAAAQNYAEMFYSKEMSEDIFVRFFLSTSYDPSYNFLYNPGLNSGANGYWGFGGNAPIGQFVDDYEMKDGTKFSWSNPIHKAAPYKGREPRFYASVLHEGAKWRQRPADVIANDPLGVIQIGSWKKWDTKENKEVEVFGLDTRKSKINANNGSYTGYYMRKFLDPSVDQQFNVQEVPWRFIRYTEILLTKAEACLSLGQESEALAIINTIRKRAGLPNVNDTGVALQDRLRHERKIELAFEAQRFFDIRRWMIAPQVMTNARAISAVYPLDPVTKITASQPKYTEISSIQIRSWDNKMYFLPIKFDEINRNDQLIQNPLY